MRKIYYLILLSLMLLILSSGLTACNNQPSTIDAVAIRAYADPATETTLIGLSESNLEKYTQYGDTSFKALTQAKLDEASTQIKNQLGVYQSKDFLRIELQQGYIIVHYKAKYSKGETGVRMVFDQNQLVAGQWFE
jgi:hypothetical protein